MSIHSLHRTWYPIIVSSALGASTGFALASGAPVTYKTSGDYYEGCFGPCLCIVTYMGPIDGTFRLQAEQLTGSVDTFHVSNVDWQATLWNDPSFAFPIVGEGTYTYISQFAIQHKLELDLMYGGDDTVKHFQTEPVFPKTYFPDISIVVSIGDMSCYDTMLTITAQPVFGDITGDALVNVDDLLEVINSWGECSPDTKSCDADIKPEFTGNNVVDVDDLLLVIENWG
jgi:hypothetical protein